MIKVLQANKFRKVFKRLPQNAQKIVKTEIKNLLEDPLKGEPKKGALKNMRVVKFKINHQLMLLAYEYKAKKLTLFLIGLGSHENFYRDLER